MNHDSAYFKRSLCDIKCLVVPPTIKVSAFKWILFWQLLNFLFKKVFCLVSWSLIQCCSCKQRYLFSIILLKVCSTWLIKYWYQWVHNTLHISDFLMFIFTIKQMMNKQGDIGKWISIMFHLVLRKFENLRLHVL